MEKLGIDIKLIAVQIINFVLLLLILKKVMYKKVLDIISERQKKLEAIDKQKVEIEKKTVEITEEKENILKSAQKERQKLLEEAKITAQAERKKIIDTANREAKELIKNTQKQLERDTLKAQKEFENQVKRQASLLVKDVLTDSIEGDLQQNSIDLAIKKISKV